jgi:DNA repair exonuclease SbcCD ATPase subunit/DNA repair exonuclease SbcCD nuclease subunit
MIKIAHMADIHIRNLKYHKEYKSVFKQLYETLKEEEVDIIYVGGDLAHTKTQLSPEYFDLCSDFLVNLADIAPTYVILGNHDGNLRTAHRQDAVTPIVETLQHPNIHLLKNSGETVVKPGLVFNVLSIFDEDRWINPTDPEAINIAFYHGSITGCRTDAGWTMQHGEKDVSIFEGFDFAMLGDIHKTNQILDQEDRVRYCGSLVQQNHGETNDKGFLIWEIEDRDNFSVRHIKLTNPKPFITIELTRNGRMPKNLKIPTGARLRLASSNNLPLNKMKRAIDIAKARFRPESISFLNRALGNRADESEFSSSILREDLRDVTVQEKLIREYLEDYELENGTLQKVFELNKKYNSIVEESEEISRNVNWKLKSIEWDNLFNYGEGNYINFENLDGIVGVFGKNFSGKSSIIDSILYTIFNSTSKNERKNLNIINQNKGYGSGKVTLSVDNSDFVIERISEKYVKKLKGDETLEAKTDLSFTVKNNISGETIELNGLTRNETDKKIRKMFGTLEDFLYSSMSSQIGSLSFIGEGSTRRKEILAKFLDLEIFERKFKLAKEDASDLRGALKRIEGREFDEEIFEVEKNIIKNESVANQHETECEKLQKYLDISTLSISEIQKKIDSVPAIIIDIVSLGNDLKEKKYELKNIISLVSDLKKKRSESIEILKKVNSFIDISDIEELETKQKEYEEHYNQLEQLLSEAKKDTTNIFLKQQKLLLLSEVPCGDAFPTCKFIKDAHEAKISIVADENNLARVKTECVELKKVADSYGIDKIKDSIEKHQKILEKKKDVELFLANNKLETEKNEAIENKLEHEIEKIQNKVKEYEDNKEAIENIEDLLLEKKRVSNIIINIEDQLEECRGETLELYKIHGSLGQKLKNLIDMKDELQLLRQEYGAYDLYQKCMHSSGISYDIIKKKLPVINNEIAKVLTNVVDFEVFFEEEGRRLNIFIKHPNFEPRPLEMGSGAEKTIAAMAIRLSLLSVSNLPKPSLFILDEPGAALDEANMEGFIRILDMVKSYFKTVLLISHLDSLKDIVDTQLSIEKNGEYAYVKHVT